VEYESDMIDTEELKPRQSRGIIPGWDWKESHTLFLLMPLVLIVLVPWGRLPYLCGRLNFPLLVGMFMFYPATVVFMVCCFFASLMRLFVGWGRHSTAKKLLLAVEIGLPIAYLGLTIGPYLMPATPAQPSPAEIFLHGFGDRVKSRADIPAIRQWLRTLDETDIEDYRHHVPDDKYPKAMRSLGYFSLSHDEEGKPHIQITYGGGFYHWAVVIGMEDMEVPVDDFKQRRVSWLLLEPGVYVYDW
jgi:hypothetical protein